MPAQVESWQDLAEHTFFHGLTLEDVHRFGLSMKSGKTFPDLVRAVKSLAPGLSYWTVVGNREAVLKEYLDGALSNEHDL